MAASVTCEVAYSIRMGALAMRKSKSIARRWASLWLCQATGSLGGWIGRCESDAGAL